MPDNWSQAQGRKDLRPQPIKLFTPNSTTANRGGPLLLGPEAALDEPKYYWLLIPLAKDPACVYV